MTMSSLVPGSLCLDGHDVLTGGVRRPDGSVVYLMVPLRSLRGDGKDLAYPQLLLEMDRRLTSGEACVARVMMESGAPDPDDDIPLPRVTDPARRAIVANILAKLRA